MTIDISKIKVGDVVHVAAKVTEIDDGNPFDLAVAGHWFPVANVTKHIPAPREFKVGDMVKWRHTIKTEDALFTVIAVDARRAWIRHDSGDWIAGLDDLTHAD